MYSVESLLSFKPEFRGSFIGNAWQKSPRPSGSWEMTSPANIDWVLPPVTFSFDHVSEAVGNGKKAFRSWADTSLQTRIKLVKNFGIELQKRSELIAKFLSLETGKPLSESLAETDLLQRKIKSLIDEGLKLVESREIDLGNQGKGEIHYRPKGLLVVIGPANLALSLPHGHIVSALLTGNVCLFKPSEKTPYSAQTYMEAFEASGFPSGVLQMVHGKAEVGIRMTRDVEVDGVMATCSFDVGAHIQKELSEKPQKIIVLALGAKNAALVLPGADLDACAEQLVKSAFMTCGQRCTALPRVYADRSLIADLLAKVHTLAKQLVVSHPFDDESKPFMGPLMTSNLKERLFRYSNIAEGEGAECVMRAKSLEGHTRLTRKPLPMGHYVSPSIHLLPRWDAKSPYQSHEIFAPDIFLCPVDSFEEGIAAVNATSYGLASSLFGGTDSQFTYFSDHVDTGVVYWNRGTVGSSSLLPFGGWKKSGNHRSGGIFSMLATTQIQTRLKQK